MDCGIEIPLFDPRRNPRDWTDLIRPTECAVFLKDRTTSAPRAPDGQPFPKPAETTCIVFDGFDVAQRFCEAKVQALPQLRCEIYDAQGLAHPPLLVIVHPDHQQKEDSSSFSSRTRKLIALGLILISGPLIWMDVRRGNALILPTFLAFNCILAGLRFLFWDFGVKDREEERRKRLDAHRKMERGDALTETAISPDGRDHNARPADGGGVPVHRPTRGDGCGYPTGSVLTNADARSTTDTTSNRSPGPPTAKE